MDNFHHVQQPYGQQKSSPMFNNRGSRKRDHPPNRSELVDYHCNMISNNAEDISPQHLTNSLDKLQQEIMYLSDHQQAGNLFHIVSTLSHVKPSTLTSVAKHKIFALVRPQLVNLIYEWCDESYLSENKVYMFRNIIKLLKMLSKNTTDTNLYPLWLIDSSFIQIIATCLTNIAKEDNFFHEEYSRESKNFTRLFTIYIGYQKRLNRENLSNTGVLEPLINPVAQCLTSNYYTKSFDELVPDTKRLKTTTKFFLIKCQSFFTYYKGTGFEQIMNSFLPNMLPRYITILNRVIPSIQQWKRPMIRAVDSLIQIVDHELTNKTIVAANLPFIDYVVTIINSARIYDNLDDTGSNPETNLMDTAMCFLADMVSGEPIILAHIKQKHETSIFLRLTSAQYESIVINVNKILAYTTTEQDIKTMTNPGNMYSTVINALKPAIEQKPNDNQQIGQLLETLKGLVQHDQMKEETMKQNALPFLLASISKLSQKDLALLLEVLWSLSFLQDAALAIRSDSQIMEKIKNISNTTTDEAIKKAADGLVWKLVREPAFLEKVAQQEAETEETIQDTKVVIGKDGKETVITTTRKASIVPAAERVFQYDMMISYCHADKDLVYQIHKFLLDEGFKIWIDLNNMFGPAMNAMADAVENSEFVLLCMSDSYKQSTYCQAEAEYAFNCKRRLLPLIVRPGYKADGWLGFMIGSRIYVDFGRFDFPTACEKMLNEINLQRKRPLPSKVGQPAPATVTTTVVTEKSKPKHTEDSHKLSKEYIKRKITYNFKQTHIRQWKESDVLDFLFDQTLHELMPLCEKMDGPALLQLHKMCLQHEYRTYNLLNHELRAIHKTTLPIGIFTRYLSAMERLISTLVIIPSPPLPLPPLPPPPPPPILRPIPQPSYLTYDVVVTTNAPPNQVIQMAGNIISQKKLINSIQQQNMSQSRAMLL